MAENRGGNRPDAPQNNYGVSATGGAGSSGAKQPVRYTAGMDNAAEYQDIQSSAPINKSGVTLPTGRGGAGAPVMQPLTPMSAPTERPDEPVSAGAALGTGPGNEALTSTTMLAMQNNQDLAKLAAYLPAYASIAEHPDATNAFRNYYRWLRSQVDSPQLPQQMGQQ
jgi:hypothetical protein